MSLQCRTCLDQCRPGAGVFGLIARSSLALMQLLSRFTLSPQMVFAETSSVKPDADSPISSFEPCRFSSVSWFGEAMNSAA